jgi:hypothetical protein
MSARSPEDTSSALPESVRSSGLTRLSGARRLRTSAAARRSAPAGVVYSAVPLAANLRPKSPLGAAASSGPCDWRDYPTRVGTSCEQIRVVDYACLPAVSGQHSAYNALRGTDARRPTVRRAPQDAGARCSVCRRVIQVLADRASAAPTSLFSRPHVGFTAARARRSRFGPDRPSGASNGPKRDDTDDEPPVVTAYRQT